MAGIIEMLIHNMLLKKQNEQAAETATRQEHIKTAHEMIKKGDLTPDQTTWLANVGAQYGDPLIEGYGRNTYKKAQEQANYGKGVQDFVRQLVGGVVGGVGVGGQQTQAQPQMGDAGIQAVPQPAQAQQMTLGAPMKGANAAPTSAGTPGYHPLTESIANAIKQVESSGGKNVVSQMGEDSYGAYQFRPKTWEMESKAYTGATQGNSVVLKQTPENEDKVAKWRINELLQAGHGPEGVANYWQTMDPNTKITTGVNDQGAAYDVPGYRSKVLAAMGQGQGQQPTRNGVHLAPPTLNLPMGATFTVTDAGSGSPKLNLQFKMPTMDERESQAFSLLQGPQQLQFLTGKWAKAAGMDPVHKIDKDETTGQSIATTYDPMSGMVKIVGSGVKTAAVTGKTGEIIGAKVVIGNLKEEELVVISKKGQVIRTSVNEIPTLGRATQGVRVMRLYPGDSIASMVAL